MPSIRESSKLQHLKNLKRLGAGKQLICSSEAFNHWILKRRIKSIYVANIQSELIEISKIKIFIKRITEFL
ncbi:hypothetical protein DCO45_12390 [Comamonas sp. JNW]|nr:hypothetical protein DCO45_12390 [Comamonas sp. JNW]